ncbi:FAD/NAD(P)-binding protein [Sphingobium boeckii]|uniref:Putative NAD(P)/FAD-binding protein YdhS n=1 Tax=Sphingobium boeckii TaxID=1082345 RepID=A0A7W9AG08_9SPHN|nr:FAD/NAD(P)-binding protein [Sphingobium boeckii]MBB5684898.1 putative NAD(P)/FAD-binding protein YdhS [Sphingobium boeckii]
MTPSVAFVGSGPTAIYTLQALVSQATESFDLTIFEEQPFIGRGTPYRPGWNDPAMLSNIASVEIPPIQETLIDWLSRQPAERLIDLDIEPAGLDDRTFYPRVALGEFFFDQLAALIERARSNGVNVTVRSSCKVLDAVTADDGMTLTVRPKRGAFYQERFDHVVLATGHQWPAEPEVRPGYFLSPWPATALAKVPPVEIGIRGSSLSAIDAAVALAVTHGAFVEEGEELTYAPAEGTDDFHMTMMSRKGLLPEADFYFAIPYKSPLICTPEAMDAIIDALDGNMLDKAYDLFRQELFLADPDYAASIALEALALEDFSDRYFAERVACDPFIWAERNLAEAQKNYDARYTVAWRYAILRMHEVIELLVPHFEDTDFKRFSRYFKPVFVDDYATVPHESIKRMLALHRAGKLSVIAIGDKYRIDSHGRESGACLEVGGDRTHFPIFIEAMGQRALSAKDFPFPSLCEQGIVHDMATGEGAPERGIVIDDQYHPVAPGIPDDQLFCLSLPFLMGRHPFIQGITSSHEIGLVVGAELSAVISRTAANASRAVAL